MREPTLNERLIAWLRDRNVPRREVGRMFGISMDTVTDIAARTRHCDPIYPSLFPDAALGVATKQEDAP